MLPNSSSGADVPPTPAAAMATAIQPSSPRLSSSRVATNPASTPRRVAILVELSDESAFAVRWAVQCYISPGDAVVLLQVRPISVSGEAGAAEDEKKLENHEQAKAKLAQPLVDAQIPFSIDVLEDHICLEAERLGLCAIIVGRRGSGADGKPCKRRLGGVSDYCVKHCVCPIVFVPYPDHVATRAIDNKLQSMLKDEPVSHEVQKGGADTRLTSSTLQAAKKFGGDKLVRCSKIYPLSVYHKCFTPSCPCNHYVRSPLQQSQAMAGQTGNLVKHSADVICRAFVKQYYHILHEQPDQLHKFYQDSSVLGRPEPNGTMVDVTTLRAINEKIMSMDFTNCTTEIETADAQLSHKDGVLIAVTGYLTSDAGVCRGFTQLFFLVLQEDGSYFVLNDVFRFMSERKPTEINPAAPLENESIQNGSRSPSVTSSAIQEPTPADRSVISGHVPTENNVRERQISNPSANGTANEDHIKAPSAVPPPSAQNQLDATKKSYASIVKAMKEGAPTPPVAKTALSAANHKPTSKPVAKAVKGLKKSSAKPTQANDASDGIVAKNNSSRNEQGFSIFVENLPFSANIEMVKEEFKKFGAIKPGGIHVRHNKVDRSVFSFVEYKSQQSMEAAVKASPICMGEKEVYVAAKRTDSLGSCFQYGREVYHGDKSRGQGSDYVDNGNCRGSNNFNHGNEGANNICRNEGEMYNPRNDGESCNRSDSSVNLNSRNNFRNQNGFSGRGRRPPPPGKSLLEE